MPDGVVDLNISWEGDDIVISWDGAAPDIYYLTGNGSGEFNNNYVENNWKKVSPEANVFSIDAGRKLLRHYGQIGGGSIEVYYKGLKAGVSPEVFIPLAPAVGKVCLNINRAESSGWNFFSYPFEDRDVNIGLIGNFNPNDEIWVWDEGMKNFTQVIKYQGSRWGQFILQRGVGHTLYRSDPNTLVATIIGKVDLKRKIISITRREATGWNFIGLPFPTQRTFEATDANENDEIWVWDNQAKGFIDRKKKSDWSKLQWLLDKDRYYLYYRSVPEYFNWEIESR